MISFDRKDDYDIFDLLEIVKVLRGPGGCPWDREQSHESLRRNLIEEAYEACEAIDEGDDGGLCEELGDVLLQIVFHSSIAEDRDSFAFDDVCDGICKKLINRHPHVFGRAEVSGVAEVLESWDEIKRGEKGQASHTEAMESVARTLPALWRAEKVQRKAAKAGFDWPDIEGALEKLSEEVEELKSAESPEEAARELGDVIFSAVNVSRFLDADPERILTEACDKFIRRFHSLERQARALGRDIDSMTLQEMDKLWINLKTKE